MHLITLLTVALPLAAATPFNPFGSKSLTTSSTSSLTSTSTKHAGLGIPSIVFPGSHSKSSSSFTGSSSTSSSQPTTTSFSSSSADPAGRTVTQFVTVQPKTITIEHPIVTITLGGGGRPGTTVTVAEATETVTTTKTVYPVLPSGFNFTLPGFNFTLPGNAKESGKASSGKQ